MAAKDRLEQLKSHIDRLKKDSLDVVSNANRIVFDGIQKLAEQELKALNDYYKSAVASLKAAKKDDLKGLASDQLDLLQDTVNKVISAARESLSIISETRAELARLIQQGGDTSAKALTAVTEPAQKAVEDVKKAVKEAKASATKTVGQVKKSLEKEIAGVEKKGKAALKEGKAALKSAEAKAESLLDQGLAAVKGVEAKAEGLVKEGKKVLKSAEGKAEAALKGGEAKAKSVTKAVKKKVGSVLDVAVPPAPVAKKAVTAKPSAESRALRAASKGKPAKKAPADAPIPAGSTMPPRKR